MLSTVAIVGRPNVGKSTLFNRLIGEQISITDDQPGVTRDRIYGTSEWLGKQFHLIDTGGIEIKDAPFLLEIKAQAEIAIDEADVIVMVADGRGQVTEEDLVVARMLQKTEKEVILVLNKTDNESFQDNLYEFYTLGLGTPLAISTIHGIGVGDLLDEIIRKLPERTEEIIDDSIRFSIIGRPNVGKSSLTNAILGEERVIVSDIEGTTRDSVDAKFKRNGQKYMVIDTAGIRKSGKVQEKAEKYAVLRAMRAIDRSDVCVIMINAEEGIREQDKHIAGYAKDANKAVIIAVNKWDLVNLEETTMKYWEQNVRAHFQFLAYAPIVFLSALTKKRVHTLYDAIDQVYHNYHLRFSTHVINDLLMDAQSMQATPKFHGGRLNILYATQVSVAPPTFVLFVNDPEHAHFSYLRYLENTLRASFDFVGTPLKFILRKRDEGA